MIFFYFHTHDQHRKFSIWILYFKARQAGDFHTDSDTVLGFFQILVR